MAINVGDASLIGEPNEGENIPYQPSVQGILSLTNRGKQCLIAGDYEFMKSRVVSNGTIQNWRCIKTSKCNGTAKTIFGSIDGLCLLNPHICIQSPNAHMRRNVIAKVKTAAIANFVSSSTAIVVSEKAGLTDAQLLSLPTDKALQDRVLRQKKPIGSTSVDKSVKEIEWLDFFTKTESGDQFLKHDSRESEPDMPVFFVFLSSCGLRLLRENSRWAVDGTFFCAPKNFVQLYTVNVFKGETTLPCVYALLPDKSAETYLRMFRVLKNLDLHPESVMMDFELAAINVLHEIFDDFASNFCLFHLSKNAFANMQSKHLHGAYNNEDARALLRCLPALAFLPVQDVALGFDEVKNALVDSSIFRELQLENNLREYLSYFEKTYIRRKVRGVEVEGLFPLLYWNCNFAALNGLPKTNNHVEGWHKGFNERFRKAKMNLSQFIVRVKAEEEKTRQLVVRARVNLVEVLRQPRRPEYDYREANIKILVRGYQPLHRMEFLKAVQHHLAKFPVVEVGEEENERF